MSCSKLLYICFLLFFSGCIQGDSTPKLGLVKGTVKIDGKPASKVSVGFVPASGGSPSVGITNENGEYELTYIGSSKGAVIGNHLVQINTVQDGPTPPGYVDPIPAKFNTASTLSKEVKAGENIIDIDITTK